MSSRCLGKANRVSDSGVVASHGMVAQDEVAHNEVTGEVKFSKVMI